MQSQKQDGCTNPLFIFFIFFIYIHTKYKEKRGLQNLRFKKFPLFNNAGKVIFFRHIAQRYQLHKKGLVRSNTQSS